MPPGSAILGTILSADAGKCSPQSPGSQEQRPEGAPLLGPLMRPGREQQARGCRRVEGTDPGLGFFSSLRSSLGMKKFFTMVILAGSGE